MYKLEVHDSIFQKYPDYVCLIIYASKLENPMPTNEIKEFLRKTEDEARRNLGDSRPAEHPHIISWRAAYKEFGSKPSKYPCSVEAMLKRVAKGNHLPAFDTLTTIYNAISIKHVIPCGGEDRDKLTSSLVLKISDGTEPFIARSEGGKIEYPDEGEVIWADSSGVTCRRWNWRQGHRTLLHEGSENVYFVLDGLLPMTKVNLELAGNELIHKLREMFPDSEYEVEIFDRNGKVN